MNLYEPPANLVLASGLALAGLGAAVWSARLIARGVRGPRPLDVVLGIRAAVLALVAAFAVVGLLRGESGFLVLGALVLAEELYETGVLALIIRRGERVG